jgi:hypothetical protein
LCGAARKLLKACGSMVLAIYLCGIFRSASGECHTKEDEVPLPRSHLS